MADPCDSSDGYAEALCENRVIEAREALKFRRFTPSGICHNARCGDEVIGDRIFCDSVCTAEYEALAKAKQRR